MEEKDVINVLRHYRHDLLNHLQIVQGYLSMGKTEKVNTKIKEYMQYLDEERKLINLNAPKFALCLIQFNSLHMNFRLTYHIHTEKKDLMQVDELLVQRYCQLVDKVKAISDERELYEVNLQINDGSLSSMIELKFNVSGNLPDTNKIKNNKENMGLDIKVQEKEDSIMYSFQVPCL